MHATHAGTSHHMSSDVWKLANAHGTTLSDILSERARLDANRDALRFVDYSVDRQGVTHTLTFTELDARASAVAASLAGVPHGERVAVLAPQSLDYVVGFLGVLRAGLIAVPLFSPDLPGHADRLTAVLADCEPTVILANSSNAAVVREFVGRGTDVLVIDEIDDALGANYLAPQMDPADVAYLQYTSGSTRLPAGVRITHGNVVINAAQALIAGDGAEGSTLVSWLPLFHDMGLVFIVGGSVVGGLSALFMDPIAFLMKPVRWLRHLADNPRSFSPAPNFAFDFCATRISEEDRATLDLSGVLTIFNGAEPIQMKTMSRFQEVFEPHGLRPNVLGPGYGLAEATVFVTVTRPGGGAQAVNFDLDALSHGQAVVAGPDARGVELVACGLGVGQTVAIADPATGVRLADGSVGEIWVNGPNVGDGYWRKPEQSAAVFEQILLGAGELPEAPWLRTGDLGLIHDGLLFVTGRIKDVLIVDGRNHYPQDLEHTVEGAHEVIGRHRTAAFSIASDNGEQAVIVAEISRHHIDGDWDPTAVAKALRTAVSREHGVSVRDIVLIAPDTIPRTTSGKIARAASRTAFESGALARVRQ